MKFTILLSLIATIQCSTIFVDLYNPDNLFREALDYQERVTTLQKNIVNTITGLRLKLSEILKKSSNCTLEQVQGNIHAIFKLDEPVRRFIFVDYPKNTDCMLNLRTQLNLHTEFSGYSSSNSLSWYNRYIDSLLIDAYGTLAEYEGLISIVQLLVVKSFNNRNIWTQPEEIIEIIKTEYENQASKWETTKANIGNFLEDLEENIRFYNDALGTWFVDIQNKLVPHYSYINSGLEVCEAFYE
ncbi:hypothetical protein PVAND_017071 [Polypedilum vanderplanki]|uniref:Uncharacterized protein n=1 Tax=Polypedilum vanderplanki TaxID=319348 RepID=A0A9J6BH17_POLVA|nr:hypothetical protein PVAND_017071 [Polypedilum vanderplanki]